MTTEGGSICTTIGCVGITIGFVDADDDTGGDSGKLTMEDDVVDMFGDEVEDEVLARFSR